MDETPGLGVIVGVGPGLGLALAKALASQGLGLFLVMREGEASEPFDRALAGFPGARRFLACDAGNPTGLKAALDQVQGQDHPVEVLIYNASRHTPGPPSRLDPADLRADLEVNLTGALHSVQAVLPGMRARGRGTILFTGGGSALHPRVQEASLGLGKGALRTLALLLAEELEPEGIHAATVTIDGFIQPGGPLDPDRIAAGFLEILQEVPGTWTRERILPAPKPH
jgi:NAD(P)-dependent dehydrogenase (short-subunit alcohol dehydrogenase family)